MLSLVPARHTQRGRPGPVGGFPWSQVIAEPERSVGALIQHDGQHSIGPDVGRQANARAEFAEQTDYRPAA